MSRIVFCIACGECIDDDAPLCKCDEKLLTRKLVQRIRETAPAGSAAAPIVGARFDHVARLAARIAAARGDCQITGSDMHAASLEAALQEACSGNGRKPDGAA